MEKSFDIMKLVAGIAGLCAFAVLFIIVGLAIGYSIGWLL